MDFRSAFREAGSAGADQKGVNRRAAAIVIGRRCSAQTVPSARRRRYVDIELNDRTNVYNTDLLQALELGSMLDCAEAVAASALARTESRGAHQRIDFVERDDTKFLRHSLAFHHPAQPPRVDYCDVVITKSQPGVRDYSGGLE
jgi:fumarate reductase flavoprotein subunit